VVAARRKPVLPVLLWILLILGVVVWNFIVWMTFTQRIR
jgi:hypothetical protein